MNDDRFKEVFRRMTAETPEPPAFADLEVHDLAEQARHAFAPWMTLAAAASLVLIVVGSAGLFGGEPGQRTVSPPVDVGVGTSSPDWIIPTDCPVTVPGTNFTPPNRYPATPSDPGHAWYGTEELWTSLPISGEYLRRKSIWWSINFGGGRIEESPEIRTVWRLLDITRDVTLAENAGTNAYTTKDGWFMIAGIDPDVAGCWEVTASYKGASLTYVYFQSEGADPSTLGIVPDVVGMTVKQAGNILHDAYFQASFSDLSDPTYEVCAQDPGAGFETNPGEVIEIRTAPGGQCD